MWRTLKRWWARVRHRHEWVVIYRTQIIYNDLITKEEQYRHHVSLERCTCGLERAREFESATSWRLIDVDWLSCELAMNNIDIPARHQE